MQIATNSKQDHIRQWTPRDHDELFRSEKAVNEWYGNRFNGKDPLIVWLGNAAGELAGLAWVENIDRKRSAALRIFGVRVYDGFREQGLGTALADEVHHVIDTKRRGMKTSYRMKRTNNAAFSIGVGLGYKLNLSGSGSQGLQEYQRNY
jgi:GNAT superfamily N-acetyltransferase